jgi:hypothetical protein
MSLIEDLGLSKDTVHWHDLASCKNIVTVYYDVEDNKSIFDPMFDSYENDSAPFAVRKSVDEMCIGCPVRSICYDFGVEKEQSGVWGGVYLSNGKHDRTRNDHKTKDLWKRLK